MPEDLVERLILIQTAHGWTDEEMSTRSGISRPMWSMLKRRRARLGIDTLGSILRAFPELREHVLDYVMGTKPEAAPAA